MESSKDTLELPSAYVRFLLTKQPALHIWAVRSIRILGAGLIHTGCVMPFPGCSSIYTLHPLGSSVFLSVLLAAHILLPGIPTISASHEVWTGVLTPKYFTSLEILSVCPKRTGILKLLIFLLFVKINISVLPSFTVSCCSLHRRQLCLWISTSKYRYIIIIITHRSLFKSADSSSEFHFSQVEIFRPMSEHVVYPSSDDWFNFPTWQSFSQSVKIQLVKSGPYVHKHS